MREEGRKRGGEGRGRRGRREERDEGGGEEERRRGKREEREEEGEGGSDNV